MRWRAPPSFGVLAVAGIAAVSWQTPMVHAQGSPQVDQEVIPNGEQEAIAKVVSLIEAGASASAKAGQRPVLRDAHAKGHGCVRAEFTVEPNLPADLAKGVFSEGRSFPAWIRFSNGNGTPHDDHAGDGRGMAIKLVGVPGPKILDDEADAVTQDFVMINFPVFFIRNALEYVPFTERSLQGKSADYYAMHPDEKAITDAITSKSVDEVFEQRYFSMTPYRLGDRYIKFSARPVTCTGRAPLVERTGAPPANNPDYLRDGMISWLAEKDACFRFAVPSQSDATMPVEDPTVLWDEARSPFVDVASIRIPRQRFDSPAQQEYCENLSFTPWHSRPEHRPVGGINRMRKAVYSAISRLRHTLNKAPRVEPEAMQSFD